MDRLRKTGKWLWSNKERLILVAMLIYLGMRVYKVFEPIEDTERLVSTPGQVPPDDVVRQLPPEGRPPRRPPGQYSTLISRNPFFYHAALARGPEVDEERWNIALLQLQEPVPGKLRARIRTESTTKWYNLGESFEEYEIQDIDMAAQTCTVYSSRYQRSKVLEVTP